MPNQKMLFIVHYSDPHDDSVLGLAGVFDNIEQARTLLSQFKYSLASIKEWPLNFGGLPKYEQE